MKIFTKISKIAIIIAIVVSYIVSSVIYLVGAFLQPQDHSSLPFCDSLHMLHPSYLLIVLICYAVVEMFCTGAYIT